MTEVLLSMDSLIGAANALFCGLVAVLTGWAALDPRIRDGVIVKLGLICMSLGSGAAAMVLYAYGDGAATLIGRAALLTHAGVGVIVVGWYLRIRRGVRFHRRASDWVPLDDHHDRSQPTA